ncbi:DNA-directed RNA polymerase specialized sigma24 family protein [Sphingomonas zeicaulis]|uniref:sigma factor n=1 Tax=Sphingomonas zeicaulis TaxID=1632740 RepID=UPI003D2220F6
MATHVLPCEWKVRAWLSRRTSPEDVDEIIQDAYCRIAKLDDVSHIDRPDAYFFSIARNLLVRRLRRQQIIHFEVIAEVDSYLDDQPSRRQSTWRCLNDVARQGQAALVRTASAAS